MEAKDLTWVLFKNDNPKTEKHPQYSGKATIGGVEYFMDAWVNEKNGRKYFSGKLKPKDGHAHSRPGGHSASRPDAQPGDDQRLPDDNVPF